MVTEVRSAVALSDVEGDVGRTQACREVTSVGELIMVSPPFSRGLILFLSLPMSLLLSAPACSGSFRKPLLTLWLAALPSALLTAGCFPISGNSGVCLTGARQRAWALCLLCDSAPFVLVTSRVLSSGGTPPAGSAAARASACVGRSSLARRPPAPESLLLPPPLPQLHPAKCLLTKWARLSG